MAVFDTAFHATIPTEASTYAIPALWRDEWGIRRYGFHGLAVQWAAEQVPVRRLVVCHLGGGCSVTAVLDGRSVDTTMGFSPLEGVPMATRSGSVDPGALIHLCAHTGCPSTSSTTRSSTTRASAPSAGSTRRSAFGVFTHRVAQAVAAMAAALGGLDAIAFSGGIGENREDVRDVVAARVRFAGDFRVEVVHAREDVVIARAVRAALDAV